MILRRVLPFLMIPLMLMVGSGTYLYLGSVKSEVLRQKAKAPTAVKPKFKLPGTMYLVQGGALFKFENGVFTQVASGSWAQPALTPDHTKLLAVSRGPQASDLYLLDLNGHVIKQLTHDSARIIDANHWAFYPRVTADSSSVLYSYDSPKYGFQVDFSIWSMPLNGTQAQARRRTTANPHTGGDIEPIPLNGTGMIFVRHSNDATGVRSQIWYQARSGFLGNALTTADQDCGQPALSPDKTQLAMICSGGKQSTQLVVAPFNGTTLGAPRVLVKGGLIAQPTWSPDGAGLAYFAPAGVAGHFELWWVPVGAVVPLTTPHASVTPGAPSSTAAVSTTAAPIVPLQVTEGLDLASTSAPAWY
ncbi:MAG: LpqB family beta-propeller domain-containing protein [Candidatus Dormibacter sp.]